jgi:hypothetical protein
MYAIVLILALGIFAVGLFLAVERGIWALFGAGCASLIAVLVTWPLAATLSAARIARQKQMDDLVAAMNDRMQQFAVLLTQISEQQLLSDRAKAVAYRTKDRDALRRAIREDMAAQDWDAAFALANDMEREFGYKQEADRFREEITARRNDIQRRAINEAVQTIDRYTGNEQMMNR